MGYCNPDKRIVHVSRAEKVAVRRMRRLAEKRELRGERVSRRLQAATRRGWWYA